MTNEDTDDLDLPDHFSEEARDLVSGVLADLDEAGEEPDAYLWAALLQAGELISTADRLDEIARAAEYVTTGSQGQEVLHPAVPQARTARVEAGKIVLGLRGKVETRNRFASGAGGSASRAAAARWSQARRGGRAVRGA
jgi:hypothetical protein